MRKLLIISDSPMYTSGGAIHAFEPTLIEIEELTKLFELVVWVGFGKSGRVEANYRQTKTNKVQLVLLPSASGGEYWYQKFKIAYHLPFLLFRIIGLIRGFQYVHTRGPSIPALIGILCSMVDSKRKYWHKFAGNWAQVSPPLSYAIQRYFLRKLNRHIVTVNGTWPDEKSNVLSFENPCLYEDHRTRGRELTLSKKFQPPFTFCFAGRLEEPKGVLRIIEAISDDRLADLIKCVHFIGDGPQRANFERLCGSVTTKSYFHGFLSKEKTFQKFMESDFLILPTTASEGFPKVIAEAANFGCIPIVSNVSSIGQYVNDINGFVWFVEDLTFTEFLQRIDFRNNKDLQLKSKAAHDTGDQFTFSRYLHRVRNEVFFLDIS